MNTQPFLPAALLRRRKTRKLLPPLLCGLCSMVATASPALAITLLVDANSNSRHPNGGHIAPYPSINAALQRARPGDSVVLRGGVYHEQVQPPRSGLANALITLRNYEGEEPVIDAGGQKAAILLQGVDYIRVQGLTLANSHDSCIVIMNYLNAAQGSSNNEILNNRFEHCGRGDGGNAIYVGGDNNLISGNEVRHHGQRPENTKGHAIYVLGNHNIVSDNCLVDNKRNGVRMEGDYNVITNNYIETSTEYGITIWVDEPLTNRHTFLQNNMLVNNHWGGIHVWSKGTGAKPDAVMIQGNRFVSEQTPFGVAVGRLAKQVTITQNWFEGSFREGLVVDPGPSHAHIYDNWSVPFIRKNTHRCKKPSEDNM